MTKRNDKANIEIQFKEENWGITEHYTVRAETLRMAVTELAASDTPAALVLRDMLIKHGAKLDRVGTLPGGRARLHRSPQF